jgi:hypothetical protein
LAMLTYWRRGWTSIGASFDQCSSFHFHTHHVELQRVSQRCLSGTQKIVSNEFVKLARSSP